MKRGKTKRGKYKIAIQAVLAVGGDRRVGS
jgi:hypothetical protein